MNLYYAPLACSLATRIALYDAAAEARYSAVDLKAKRLADGSDFLAVNPMGQVPALRMADGGLLTENTAILQHVADAYPNAGLAPQSGAERAKLQQWLGFIGTELHKAVFVPMLDSKAPEAVKAYAREKVALRMEVLQDHLAGREFLLNRFSVADAYLVTVLNWTVPTGVSLQPWPAVAGYYQRLLKRPSVARAVGEEMAMYKQEQARLAAA